MVVGLWLQRKKNAYKAQAKVPFTHLPLRPPGESVRLRVEKLSEELDTQIFTIALAGAVGTAIALSAPERTRWSTAAMMFTFVGALTIWCCRRLSSITRELWDHRLAFTGERIVGEELNQLLASGFRVFHDVPFDNFNIDHVIVGPPGVYIVETKAWRKPANIKGTARATVEVYGDRLELPRGWNEEAVPQARRNAKTLAEWLTKATGERVVVSAILTLPGWMVNRRQVHDVNVLNPQEIRHSFPSRPKHPLTPEQMQRIVHQLTERCRMGDSPKGGA